MYTVYKTINKINNKFYIGVHRTDDPNDLYFGSGLVIKKAIKKYGKNNFFKEILYITEDKDIAFHIEKSLTILLNDDKCYNIKRGGTGGFTKEACIKGANSVNKLLTQEQRSERTRKGNLTRKLRKNGNVA